jgi:hypothetical protein
MASEDSTPVRKKATASKKATSTRKPAVKKATISKKTTARKVVKKAETKQAPARAKTTPRPSAAAAPHQTVSAEQRREMIATMAYYRAQARGFEGGTDMEDWLESERAVDQLLAGVGE